MSENTNSTETLSHTEESAQNCEVCHGSPPKYKCPGCMLRTCSLECSKAHKDQTGCTGRRDRTKFVKRGEFNENTLISDLNFLQELKRDHSTAVCAKDDKETRKDLNAGNSSTRNLSTKPRDTGAFNLNRAQKTIISRAKGNRHVLIRYMSPGIQRHDQNKTIWAASKSRLVWTLEIIVPEIEIKPNKWIETGFHDVCKLSELWTRLLNYTSGGSAGPCNGEEDGKEPTKKRMKTDIVRIQLPSDDGAEHPFRSSICKILLDSIKQRFGDVPITQTTWLIRVQDMPANKPTFSVLDPQQALYTQLKYQTVIEFPTIYVFNKVPTIWDGYEITIQKNVVENSSTDQKTRSHDEHGDGVDNDDIATDAKILPLTDE